MKGVKVMRRNKYIIFIVILFSLLLGISYILAAEAEDTEEITYNCSNAPNGQLQLHMNPKAM